MPPATRRGLLATAPALAAGSAAATPAELSEVAAAYAAYQPLRDSSPLERDFLFPDVELPDDEHPIC